jgi:hypothetical protein
LEPRKQEPGSGTVSFNGIDLLTDVCRGAAEEAVISAAQQASAGTETRSSTEAGGEAADAGVASSDRRRGTHEYSKRGAAR